MDALAPAGEGLAVPLAAVPVTRLVVSSFDFGGRVGAKDATLVTGSPAVMSLGTDGDAPPDWPAGGRALQACLVEARGPGGVIRPTPGDGPAQGVRAKKRRGGDLNPRRTEKPETVFETPRSRRETPAQSAFERGAGGWVGEFDRNRPQPAPPATRRPSMKSLRAAVRHRRPLAVPSVFGEAGRPSEATLK